MRISTMMMFDSLVRNLAKATEKTQEIQEVIATGKKINRLSDDPIGITRILHYQSDLVKLSQYKENITYGNSWLSMSDSVVQDMQNLVSEAKNIAIAQSTSTVSSENRAHAAVAVQNFYNQLIDYANTKLGGNYIFGGTITDSAPFNANGTYNGNGDDLTVEILEGVRTKINLAGSEFLITDLNPDLSTAAPTAGTTSSTGLVAKNINTVLASPSGLSEHKVAFVLANGLTQEVTYATDSNTTRDELGSGIADAVNNHDTLNQYIRASYDATTGNITFAAKEVGTGGNTYTIDAANSTVFEGTINTTFAGGRSAITSGFVFDATNSDIVFEENGNLVDITANIITDGGAVSGQVYTGDQVASFIERAMEATSGLNYSYTVSYDESTNLFTIVNDTGNGGTLDLRWSAGGTTAEQTLGFNSVDSGDFAAGGSDVSDNQVELNVLNNVNDKFRVTIDGTPSAADIDISAGAYTTTTIATEMQTQINNDAAFAGITVDFGVTISGQFTITSSTTGTSSTVTLTSDATEDFLRSVGLDRDFEISGTSPTPLADLNGGNGVTAGNITITDRAGNSAVVAVAANQTVADVINNINAAAINVTAQLNSEGNGIDIIDNNGFPIQNLVVADNSTARDLGIVGNKPGTIYGADLNPAVSNATRINMLEGGNGLTLNAITIVNGLQNETVDLSRATSMTDILTAINNLGISATAAINSSKTALDVNSTTSDTVAIMVEVDGGTTASDLGIQGGSDFLKTLAVLQEALEKNDRYAILNMLDQFDLILAKLVEKGSEVGVRANQLDAMNRRITATEIETSELKSDIEDADMVEYLTKFAMQQTALEAMMSAAAKSMQISLLNFLR
jgi:flagellar hook-associated protein 3